MRIGITIAKILGVTGGLDGHGQLRLTSHDYLIALGASRLSGPQKVPIYFLSGRHGFIV